MTEVITVSDHIPIMTSSVRTTGCTHIDRFQEIGFPLGIISVKDIDVTTKADIETFVVSKGFQFETPDLQ